MVDAVLQSELLAACSSLGYSDGSKYHLEADCLETVKDLVRYLRRDDDSHQIRRALGETRVVQTDLIPILKHHSNSKDLFDVTLRLLINLTNPVLLLFKEELPEEKVTRQQFMQILTQQQGFKEAFADDEVWGTLVGYLGKILDDDWDEREEEDRLIIERILILVRNVLAAPSSPEEEKRTDDDASIHDQVLWALHLARFEDLLLYIATSENEQDLCMHVLEIIKHMFKEQDAAHLAHAGLQRSVSEKQKDEEQLLKLRERENMKKMEQMKKHYNARHSRFGGVYYVSNMKSISNRELISHQHISDIKSINFDNNKKSKKIPKNRQPLTDVNLKRRSTLAIRLFLQEFCIEFLNGAYNSLMYIVKDNLDRARAQEHDESYYIWAIVFFLKFNRSHNFKVELITESLNVQQFHYLQTLLEHYFEMMTTDKKKIPLWSSRMHNALCAYEELLMTLSFMDKSDVSSVRESSKILKSKVFYVVEYRELVLILLQNFDELKMTKTYLKDLVETVHVFLKMLEGICGKQKHLIVQKKLKTKKNKSSAIKNAPLTEDELINKWDEFSASLLEIIASENQLPETIPFDSLSDLSEDQQKENSMRKIHKLLRTGEIKESLSLLRSCRDVWPEGDIFGSNDLDPVGELACLRAIYLADLNPDLNVPLEEEEEEYVVENVKEELAPILSEQEFNFHEFVRRFAHTKVVQAYSLIFKDFFDNSEHTNHCVLKMFHRLAWDCKLPGIFFQASLFRVFYKILDAPGGSFQKEAVQFIKFILRKFFGVTKSNKKVFAELLFWKTNKEALELEVGYGSSEAKAVKVYWKEEEEDELQRLFEEFRDSDSAEKDIVDLIMDNLINKERSRRMVIKKLKDMSLINDLKELSRKTVRVRAPKHWTEEEDDEVRSLYEEYKDSIDPIARIIDHMSVKRPKQRVIDKIIDLGLVQDKKQLRKKRVNTGKTNSKHDKRNQGEAFLAANASESESDMENAESENIVDSDSSSDEVLEPKQIVNVTVATPENILEALRAVCGNGRNEPVQWIADLLNDTADDREEDGDFEPVPILAITDSCTDAMEDPAFEELLKLIGLQAPVKQQEMFWRIPASFSVQNLRKRAQFLLQGLDGKSDILSPLEIEDNTCDKESSERENCDNSKSPILLTLTSNSLNDKGRKFILNEHSDDKNTKTKVKKANDNKENIRKINLTSPLLSSEESNDDDHHELITNTSHKRMLVDSDDEDSMNKLASKRPRAIILDDSSDED